MAIQHGAQSHGDEPRVHATRSKPPVKPGAINTSVGSRLRHRCIAASLAVGLAIGLIEAASAEAINTSEFELAIRNNGLVLPDNVIRVRSGDMVRLRWTTDAMITVHLHGYDIEKKLSPDMPAVMFFEAHATGRFPVNLHGRHEHGDSGTLLYLEVLPR